MPEEPDVFVSILETLKRIEKLLASGAAAGARKERKPRAVPTDALTVRGGIERMQFPNDWGFAHFFIGGKKITTKDTKFIDMLTAAYDNSQEVEVFYSEKIKGKWTNLYAEAVTLTGAVAEIVEIADDDVPF